jgi:hypothetical protein
MKLSCKSLLIFTFIWVVGCSKEEPLPAPAPVVAEPVIFKQQIQTLHKAEALDQAAKDAAMEQHKQIEAATQ